MKAREIMTWNPACCVPDDSARTAARLMRDHDCGCLPVIDPQSSKVVGVVTDRDLVLRAVAEGKAAETKLSEVMTPIARCCGPDDDLRDVELMMSDLQVRRVPIVDSAGCCVGIISQADLALAAKRDDGVTDREIAMVVEQISEPSTGHGRADNSVFTP